MQVAQKCNQIVTKICELCLLTKCRPRTVARGRANDLPTKVGGNRVLCIMTKKNPSAMPPRPRVACVFFTSPPRRWARYFGRLFRSLFPWEGGSPCRFKGAVGGVSLMSPPRRPPQVLWEEVRSLFPWDNCIIL